MSGFWDEPLVRALASGEWLTAAELADAVEAASGSYVDGASFSMPLGAMCESGEVERRKRAGSARFEYRSRVRAGGGR